MSSGGIMIARTTNGFITFFKCRGKKGFIIILLFIFSGILVSTRYHSAGFRRRSSFPPYENDSLSLEMEFRSLDASQDFFLSAKAITKKLRSRWLYGRTTNRKKHFDDEYIDLNNRVQTLLQRTENERRSQLRELSKGIRDRIIEIQNPADCDTAKLLVYDVATRPYGFGSNMHMIIMHFIHSIYSNRTFVLQSSGWTYDDKSWEYYLQPLGKCTYEMDSEALPILSDETQRERIVQSRGWMVDIDWSVPENILDTLKRIHTDPFAWWVGQFMSYAFRLQPWLEARIQAIEDLIGFTDKVAGIHVRWGDKVAIFGSEAAKHDVSEYMDFVETWFRSHECRGCLTRRVVYVATENSEVWADLKSRYPEYTFIGGGFVDENRDINAPIFVPYRGRKFVIQSVLTDMYFLSKSDYVVCTSSSNIGRAVYELMMMEKVSPPDRFQSLDLYYHLAGPPRYAAVQSHRKRDPSELDMQVGDELSAVYDAFYRVSDGYHRGVNLRTGQEGSFPSYKTEITVKALKCNVFEGL